MKHRGQIATSEKGQDHYTHELTVAMIACIRHVQDQADLLGAYGEPDPRPPPG